MTALPNFFIIGAARSGTNALYHYLGQHPAVYLCPLKEPRFFAFEGAPPAFSGHKPDDYSRLPTYISLDAYTALFEPSPAQTAVGEGSTVYLYYPGDKPAERIRALLPQAKLIAVLRQPAERAYSNFLLARENGWDPLDDFAAALAVEDERARANWSYFLRYRQNGLYYQQLQRYYRRFPAAQIKVVLYDDLVARPLDVVRDLFAFLDVDARFAPDVSGRHLPSRHVRFPFVRRLLREGGASVALLPARLRARVGDWNHAPPARLDPELRRRLTEDFRPDVLALQDLIDRDLSHWLRD